MKIALRYHFINRLQANTMALGLLFCAACGSNQNGTTETSDAQGGGTNTVNEGGTKGTTTSSSAAGFSTGGSLAQGGTAGASIGLGGAGTGGAGTNVGGLDPFWTSGYDATQSPAPTDGYHHPGQSCMKSGCHDGSEPTAAAFLMAGTVFGDTGFSPAPNVEVGVSDGSHTYFTYTAGNGNFWLPASLGSLNFKLADIRIVNSKGQKSKLIASSRGPDCNSCHAGTTSSEAKLLIAP